MPTDLELAKRLSAEQRLMIEQFPDRPIRVVRAVTYEGPARLVLGQLAMSLPIGVRDCRGYTITVAQGDIEVVDNPEPEPERPDFKRAKRLASNLEPKGRSGG